MKGWAKKLFEDGLIETIKPTLEQPGGLIEKVKQHCTVTMYQAGLIDAEQLSPKTVISRRLEQVVGHILQRPPSDVQFIFSELLSSLPDLMLLHPKLRGAAAILKTAGLRSRPSTDSKLHTIVGGFFGGRYGNITSKLASGHQRYQQQHGNERNLSDLNPSQRQVIELATAILAALNQPTIDCQIVNDGIGRLEAVLQDDFALLVDGLDEEHGSALNGLCYGRWPRVG